MGQFGISQPVLRREDPRLLRGEGRFVDDIAFPGMAHGFVLRSPHAHARIRGIDTGAASAAPGVLAVFTGQDIAADRIGAIHCLTIPKVKPGTEFRPKHQPLLAAGCAKFVGDGVAFVVAETPDQARDAAELIEIDYEPLPAVTIADRAEDPDAPQVWDDVPRNVMFDWELGDGAAVEAAFARAARIVTLDVVNNRIVQNAMETRGAIGLCDPETGKLTLYAATQMPNRMRTQLARDIFQLPPELVRVVVRDVGGGFGGKNALQQEHGLVLYAARRLGRPVKWIGQRSDAFLSDFHGRDNVTRGELALDADGHFLAVRTTTHANLGAYSTNGGPVAPTGVVMLPNAYRTAAVHVQVKAMFTNTVPIDSYRGAGRPEVTYLMERLVETAARELDVDPAELRRRNYIPPKAFPYKTPTGLTYIHADFEPVMEQAMAATGWRRAADRKEEARRRGRLYGIGMSNYIERCGGGGGLSEAGRIRFEPDGSVTVLSGSQSNGQGHETAFSQIVHDRLGVDFEKIRVIEGDTDQIPVGLGTGGSWSVPMGGGALALASDRIIEKAKRIAAHALEAAEADIEFRDGRFGVAGTDLAITIEQVARAAFNPAKLPEGMEPGLDAEERFTPENYTFPYGCHVCEVEIDPETGRVEVLGYTAVHDFGRPLNPLLLEGQVHGGVTQGIGQALLERTVYDEHGQLLTGSYMDYCLPRADDLPAFAFSPLVSPSPSNPLDIKGCGEAGATGSPPAVINAIVDALAPLGVRHVDMPATPERVWAAMRGAGIVNKSPPPSRR